MRFTRFRKYRKKHLPLFIVCKVVVSGYLVLFSASFLTADTAAYFHTQAKVNDMTITAGTWEEDQKEEAEEESDKRSTESPDDESTMNFIDMGSDKQLIDTCPADIEATIENTGDGPMLEPGTYDIYYAEAGNPKEGKKLQLDGNEGIVKKLDKGEIQKLTYETDKSGIYIFKTYQPGEKIEENEVWSNKVNVDCPDEEGPKEEPEKEQEEEETTEEEKDSQKDVKAEEDKKTETPKKDKKKKDAKKEPEETADKPKGKEPQEEVKEPAEKDHPPKKQTEKKPKETQPEKTKENNTDEEKKDKD